MEQKPSDALAALAAAEGFHLTPIYDPRIWCAWDSRDMRGSKVLLDGQEMKHVRRAYVGENGWVDLYPVDSAGNLMVKDDELVVERHPGSVKILMPDGRIYE